MRFKFDIMDAKKVQDKVQNARKLAENSIRKRRKDEAWEVFINRKIEYYKAHIFALEAKLRQKKISRMIAKGDYSFMKRASNSLDSDGQYS